MTIAKYIVDFLSKLCGEMEIDTNHVSDGSDKYGLFKSPARDIKNFNDASYEITEHYQFIARQKALSDAERKEADEWMEDMTYRVDDYPYLHEYQPLDKNRTVTGIAITGCPYPEAASDKDMLYQISLSITYLREREE